MDETSSGEKQFPPVRAFLWGIAGGVAGCLLSALLSLADGGTEGLRYAPLFFPYVGAAASAGVASWKKGSSGVRTLLLACAGVVSALVIYFIFALILTLDFYAGIGETNYPLASASAPILITLVTIISGALIGMLLGKPSIWRTL